MGEPFTLTLPPNLPLQGILFHTMWQASLVGQLIFNHPQTQRFRIIPLALIHPADGEVQSTMHPLVSHFLTVLF